MKAARWLLIFLSILCLGAAQEQTYTGKHLTDFPGPQVCKDPTSGTLLYVESDGRHVAAISRDGKLLWNRDPFKDAHLPFYRTENRKLFTSGQPRNSTTQPAKSRKRSLKFRLIVHNSDY
jgi:hypothetical protein